MSTRQLILIAAVLLGILAAFNSFYIVDQRERVLLFQLGKLNTVVEEPGIEFKWPFVQDIRRFDKRLLTLDNQTENFLTSEKKNVKVDFFVKWRIRDTATFYRATGGQEIIALDRLASIVNRGLRDEFGQRTIQEAISGERNQIMRKVRESANDRAEDLGITVSDVRIKRIDLPDEVRNSVYDRMRAERQRVASDLRARGAEEAERLRAEADREAEIIIANAYRDAEILRGEGDAKAAAIYAEAYERDTEFYSFHRTLEVYRRGWADREDVLVLEPDSPLFRYFGDANGSGK